MPIYTLADLRSTAPEQLKGVSDQELIQRYASHVGMDPVQVANTLGYDNGASTLTKERISGSIDNYQSGLYETGAAVAGVLGLDGARKFAERKAADNRFQAEVAGARAKQLGGVESYEDVDGVSSGVNYLGGLAAQSLPYAAEAMIGGWVGRVGATGLKAASIAGRAAGATEEAVRAGTTAQKALNLRSMGGATVASYPSAMGDILGNQREQIEANGGEMNYGSAALGAVPYSLLNGALGINSLLGRGKLARSGVEALDNLNGWKGAAARTGASVGRTMLEEGASELGQEFVNQGFGRMAVDPNETFFNPESEKRFRESFVGGAALGGAFGAVGGHRRSGKPNAVLPQGESVDTYEPVDLLKPAAPAGNGIDYEPTNWTPEQRTPYEYDNGLQYSDSPIPPRYPDYTGGLQMPVASLDGAQQDLFSLDDAPLNQYSPLPNREQAPVQYRDTQTPDMLEQTPSAMVPTMFNPQQQPVGADVSGRANPAKGLGGVAAVIRSRLAQQTGKADGFTTKLAFDLAKHVGSLGDLTGYIDEQDMVLDKALAKLDRQVSGGSNMLDPQEYAQKREAIEQQRLTLEAARTLAQEYQTAQTNALVEEARAKAQPGKRVGTAPAPSTATEDTMRAGSKAVAMKQAVADTDARVQDSEAAKTAEGRMSILRAVLAAPTRNAPEARFRAALIAAGYKNLDITPEERSELNRVSQRRSDVRAATVVPPGLAASRGKLTSRESLNEPAQQAAPDVQPAPAPANPVVVAPPAPANPVVVAPPAPANPVVVAPPAVAKAAATAPKPAQPAKPVAAAKSAPAPAKPAEPTKPVEVEKEKVDATFDELQTLRDKRKKLRSKTGAAPAEGTTQRDEWDALSTLIDIKTEEWRAEDEKIRHGVVGQRRATKEDVRNSEESEKEMAELAKAKPKRAAKDKALGQPVEKLFELVDTAKDDDLYKSTLDALYRRYMETNSEAEEATILSWVEDQGKGFTKDWLSAERRYDSTERGVRGGRGFRGGDSAEGTKSNIDKDTVNLLNGVFTRFSLGKDVAPAKQMTTEAIQQVVDRALKFLKTRLPVTIVDSPADIGLSAPPGTTAAGVFYKGQIYLFREGIESETEALRTVFHEMFHLGMRKILGEQQYNQRMMRLLSDPLVRKYADRWKSSGDGQFRKGTMPTQDWQALAVEEALADIAEDLNAENRGVGSKELNGFVRTAISWMADIAQQVLNMPKVAQALRRMTLTEAEAFVQSAIARVDDARSGGDDTKFRAGERASSVTKTPANNGDFDPTNPDIRYRQATLEQREAEAGTPKHLVDKMKRTAMGYTVRDIWAGWRRQPWRLGFLTLDQIKDRFTQFKNVAHTVDVWLKMGARATEIMRLPSDLHKQWASLTRSNAADAARLNDLLIKATVAEAWVDGTGEPKADKRNAHLDFKDPKVVRDVAAARSLFVAMSPEAKALYSAITKELDNQFRLKQEALLKRTVDAYADELLDVVSKDELMKMAQEGKKYRDDMIAGLLPALTLRAKQTLHQFSNAVELSYVPRNEVPGPYFPLTRTGDNVVVFKSHSFNQIEKNLKAARDELDRLLDAEPPGTEAEQEKLEADVSAARKAVNEAREALGKLKADDGDYIVQFFKSASEAEDVRANLQRTRGAQGTVSEVITRQLFEDRTDSVPASFLNKLQAQMQKELPEGSAKDVGNVVRQMIIKAMPERSVFKAELTRMKVAGAKPEDAMTSFVAATHRNAWTISRLENITELSEAMNNSVTSDDQDERKVGNELKKRYNNSLIYTPGNAMIDLASNMSYITHLGFSVGYYFQNTLQPFTVTLPVMAGEFGYGKASSALGSAWKEVATAVSATLRHHDNKTRMEMPIDLDQFKEGERDMLDAMVNQGLIDVTIRADMGVGSSSTNQLGHVMQKAAELSSLPAHMVEVVNRVSTALAVYRLAVAKGMTHEQAMAKAEKTVVQTHVDYSLENAPRFMNPNSLGGLGRLAFQFKRYQQAMVFLWGKLLVDAKRGDRDSARALFYLTGTNVAMAGVSGLPIAAPLGLMLSALSNWGDDDEERDLAQYAWAGIRGVVGEDIGNLAQKGIPAMIGVDMSKRVGSGDILSPIFRLPQANTGQEWMGAISLQLFGAAGGMAANWADALMVARDNPAMAIQKVLPVGLKSFMQAVDREFISGGLTDRKGNVTISSDELGGVDFVAKLLNLGESTKVANMYDARSAVTTADTKRQNMRSRLMREYTRARLEGDSEAMVELRSDIDAFNSRNPADVRILPKNLMASFKQENQRRREMSTGIRVTKRNADLAEDYGITK